MIIDDRPRFILRHMTFTDVDPVVELDQLSFPTPWPARTYRYEINNDKSHMIVLEDANTRDDQAGLPAFITRLMGRNGDAPLAGYGGMWQIIDEAHISTIAVHPDWRGYKLGELLLWGMIRQAVRDEAAFVTLEVRISNEVAMNLYRKYGFKIVGRRKKYYRDNNEDAHIMSTDTIDAEYRHMMVEYGRELARINYVDDRL